MTELPAVFIHTQKGCFNKLIVSHHPSICAPPKQIPTAMLPEYEVDWHVDSSTLLNSKICIQVYNNKAQITIRHRKTTGYLHLRGERERYHLLLASTAISLTNINNKASTWHTLPLPQICPYNLSNICSKIMTTSTELLPQNFLN